MCFTVPISYEYILAATLAVINAAIRVLASSNSIGGKSRAAASQSGSLLSTVRNDAPCQIFKQPECKTFRIHTGMFPIPRLPNSSGKSVWVSDPRPDCYALVLNVWMSVCTVQCRHLGRLLSGESGHCSVADRLYFQLLPPAPVCNWCRECKLNTLLQNDQRCLVCSLRTRHLITRYTFD